MTNQELRIAVAEADGWKHISEDGLVGVPPGNCADDLVYVPPYENFMSHIHAAVNRKDELFQREFAVLLAAKAVSIYDDNGNDIEMTHKLTAKNWCEVYVEVSKTLKDK